MTQKERMEKGMLYDPGDDAIMNEQFPYLDRLGEFNSCSSSETKKREELMKEMFAECGENCYIQPPFYANWSGHHIHLGKNVYANFNLTVVDDGEVYIGDLCDDWTKCNYLPQPDIRCGRICAQGYPV